MAGGRALRRLLLLAAAAAPGLAALRGADAVPAVLNVTLAPGAAEAHHTDHYDLVQGGAAVRRGQAFDVIVTANETVHAKKMDVVFVNSAPAEFNNPQFSARIKHSIGQHIYLVEVTTPVESPIGKYQDITVSIRAKGGDKASGEAFAVADPLYLLFNPWIKEDAVVYLPTEEMRQEHVINEYGNVYGGSLGSYETTKWYYGQSNQVALDAAFFLLEKVDRARAADVIHVVQTIARNQGMMRKADGSVLVGTEEAILEGNWGDSFDDTNNPDLWTSVIDIINRWRETGRPTQYGQCWVFAALQNTLMRSIGVGSRQLTAFGAWMDLSSRRDKHHKLHHVADDYYDITGKRVYSESQAWNYHSWNDIWIKRDDDKLSGWQSLDGTPPGKIGPAPLRAIHDLTEQNPFNVSDVISTVHSTSRSFLVKCAANHTKADHLKHCEVENLLAYDHTGLHLILSSATAPNGALLQHNITSEFIDPSKDAFIPFDPEMDATVQHGRHLRAGAALPQPSAHRLLRDPVAPADAVNIVPNSYGVIVGAAIDGVVELDTSVFQEGEHVKVNMMFTLETYRGIEIKEMISISERVLIKGSKVILPFSVDPSAYLQADLGDVFVRIVVTGVSDSGVHIFAKDTLDIDSPPLSLFAPATVVAQAADKQASSPETFPALATFRNPLQFALKNVCITLHSHQLAFSNREANVTSVTECKDLRPGAKMDVSADILLPTKAGVYYVLASLQGEFLPFSQAHSMISATAPVASSVTAPELVTVSEISLVGASDALEPSRSN